MNLRNYPMALRGRLGEAATTALADVLTEQGADLTIAMTNGFERRLGEECNKIRVEMAALRTDLQAEMRDLRSELRADFRVEVANVRSDLLKWSFVFWVGQMAAVFGLMTVLQR
ncbi:MAG TPA: hypothetical protein VNJ02_06005 [Vicinamibacterales bacterium]|nr:hypothetical protein [Vicinamibacterales bacterium]